MKYNLLLLAILISMHVLGQAGQSEGYAVTNSPVNNYSESARQVLQQSDGKLLALFRVPDNSPRSVLARFNAKGLLDNNFGNNGFSSYIDVIPVDAALQNDGKIIIVGTPYSGDPFIPAKPQIVVARFNADGQLDRSFGTNGFFRQNYGLDCTPAGVVSQPDGKIVVAGYSNSSTGIAPVLLRVTGTGSLDPSFANGVRTIALPTTPYPTIVPGQYNAITLQSDGKIVVAGGANVSKNSVLARFNANGSPDLTFSDDGLIYEDLSSNTETVRAVAVQADGKILLGASDQDFIVSRYKTDGSLDESFNGTGRKRTDFGSYDNLARLAVRADGKIFAMGYQNMIETAVYNPDGSNDLGFGNGGLLLTPGYIAPDGLAGILLQADSKLVIAATTQGNADLALLRYTINGSPDNSFSNDGQLRAFFSLPDSHPVLTANVGGGQIVVSTYNSLPGGSYILSSDYTTANQFEIKRYINREPDLSFGTNGVTTSFLGTARAVATQPDGKFLVAGGNANITMARYSVNGIPDNNFGTNGQVNIDFGNAIEYFTAIQVLSDGKILGMIKSLIAGTASFSLARYNADGTVDATFNGGVPLATPFGGQLKIQSDGKIIIAGTRTAAAGNKDFAVARYLANGSPDPTFSGDGIQTTDFALANDSITAIGIQDNGRIVAGGFATVGSRIKFAVASYNPDGSPDLSFSSDGKTTIEFGAENDRLYALSLQTDGKIVVGGETEVESSGQIAIARLTPRGELDPLYDDDGKITDRPSPDDPDGSRFVSSFAISGPAYAGISGYRNQGALVYYSPGDVSSPVKYAINYRYYEGNWSVLPDFNAVPYVDYGTTSNINLSTRPAATSDHFGFLWEGKINLPSAGTYTFELRSDDGSKFYFNQPYSFSATPLVNNDGVHSVQSATGSVNVPAAGAYPFALAYFEGVLDETLELHWSGPGFSRQLVPASAFTDARDLTAPTPPANLLVKNLASSFAFVDWDKSFDAFGVFEYDVTVLSNGPFRSIQTKNTSITIDSLLPNTDYNIYVYARDAAGNRSSSSNLAQIHTGSSPNGLTYRYYEGDWNTLPDFDAIKTIKTGNSPNVDLGIKEKPDYFGGVWQGKIRIPVSGAYTFEILSDDGSRLYFDKLYAAGATPLIDNDGLHYASKSATIQNVSAGWHNFAIAYFEKWGGETLEIFWSGPGFTRQPIPASAFSDGTNPVANLEYKFYEGDWNTLPDFSKLTPTKTGTSGNVDLTARRSGVDDYYGFVWNGYIKLPAGGQYTFETASDDGSKLYFNSHYVESLVAPVNNDGLHGDQTVAAVIYVPAAGVYPISMTFFEKWGGESMKVYYSGPGIPRQLIPSSAFVSKPADNVRPTAPQFLRIVAAVNGKVALGWINATDDQLITGYRIYVNGLAKYIAPGGGFDVPNIDPNTVYKFRVSTIDQAGNESDLSNEIVYQGEANLYAGLKYKYYEGDWSSLPNFNTLTPLKQGIVAKPDLSVRNIDDYFSVLYQGKLYIPEPGLYTFELSSDDGSRFYFNSQYSSSATPLIDNDGLHGDQPSGKATINIPAAGYYPIAVSYFEKWGAESLNLVWSSANIARAPIDARFFSYDPDPVAMALSSNSTSAQRLDKAVISGEKFSVYPNPFVDRVQVSFENKLAKASVDLDVFDTHGKLVFTQKMLNQPIGNLMYPVRLPSKLAQGVYSLRLSVNGIPVQVGRIMK